MRLHLRHGWGYDAGFWTPLATALGVPFGADDRGYFGAARADPVEDGAPYVLVGHSLGAMRMLGEAGPDCRGLVAIDGFDRFAAAPGFPGVPLRMIDAMLRRCVKEPGATVADFRRRYGDESSLPAPATSRLLDDLQLLRDGDARPTPGLPLLRIDGGADPLLTPAHRAACFPGTLVTEVREGGHLLPLTHPDRCAAAILAFVDGLA